LYRNWDNWTVKRFYILDRRPTQAMAKQV